MLRLEMLRREAGFSRSELARRARLQPGVVSLAERGLFTPYPSQLAKMAGALGERDPRALLDEVATQEAR